MFNLDGSVCQDLTSTKDAPMVFKPNYNLQRAERDRAKVAKKEEKAREKQEAKRLADKPEDAPPADVADAISGPNPD